jgi:Bifunctional DNA primase/polymerase, N-terminal
MTRADTARLLAHALAAARRGWCVFPLIPGEKRPAIPRWPQQATTDPDQITAWWTTRPYNLGIATGPSRLVVIDLDTFKPGDTIPQQWQQPGISSGADVLAALAEQHHQPYPAGTFTVTTAGGGGHLYFTHPDHGPDLRNTAGTTGSGLGFRIDTRAHGGMVVGPGSTTAKGTYRVRAAGPAVPLPDWLTRLLTPAPRPAAVFTAPHRATGRTYAYAALANEQQAVGTSPAGEHNAALLRAARGLSRFITDGTLTQAVVEDSLSRSAQQTGMSERRALSVIRHAIEWATTHDRRQTA